MNIKHILDQADSFEKTAQIAGLHLYYDISNMASPIQQALQSKNYNISAGLVPALKKFQADNGLYQSGHLDEATAKKLGLSVNIDFVSSMPTYQKGKSYK